MPKATIFYTFLPKTQNCVKQLSRNSLIVFSYKKDVENETFSSSKRWLCDANKAELCKPYKSCRLRRCKALRTNHRFVSTCKAYKSTPFKNANKIFFASKIKDFIGAFKGEEDFTGAGGGIGRSPNTKICSQNPNPSKKILQTINGVEKTINKKQLFAPSSTPSAKKASSITCTISGGQDSVFLLFCLSVLQPQLNFNLKLIWCNHFWQTSSFYTTLHLTKCAVSFSSPIIGFLPFQINVSPWFYKTVIATYKKNNSVKPCFKKKSTALGAKPALHPLYVKFRSNVEMQSSAFLRHRSLKRRFRKVKMQRMNRFCWRSYQKQTKKSNGLQSCFFKRLLPEHTNLQFVKALLTKPSSISHTSANKALRTNRRFVSRRRRKPRFANKAELCKPKAIKYKSLPGGAGGHATKICKKILLATRFVRRSPRDDLYSPQKRFRDVPLRTLFFCTPGLTINPAFLWSLLSYKIELKEKGYKGFLEKTSEVEARNWRHITTERGSTFYDSKRCVYGHTGSDRVETILFNLIRGSGSRGVACLPWKRDHSHFCYNKFYPSYKQVIKNTHLRSKNTK